ncbi:hypothetical protein [Actinopolymorpha alba]|uniref:hypothetical protein n=1 Tax=Actinopolymorpha alba TaxID=533267 RepID=UPI00035C85C0|nr:hypothetical protein [Actinopolymorpha alba]
MVDPGKARPRARRWDVVAEGAAGNGVDDDTETLAGVFDKAAAGDEIWYTPDRAFKLTAPITLNKPLRHLGYGAELVQTASDTTGIRLEGGASGTVVAGLTFRGPQGTTYEPNGRALHVTGTPERWFENLFLHDVTFRDWGYGGLYARWARHLVTLDVVVEDVQYAGLDHFSCADVHHWNPTVRRLTGIPKNGFMQSYGIAFNRWRLTNLTEDPRCDNCWVWGGEIDSVPWEAIDTHGGARIHALGTRITNSYHGFAAVPSPDPQGVDTYAPLDILAAHLDIDGEVDDGSKGSGIRIVGAGRRDNTVERSTGHIIGGSIARMGSGIDALGRPGDRNTTAGGVQLYLTRGVTVTGTHIKECRPFGVSLWYDNSGVLLDDITVVDPWHPEFPPVAAVASRDTGNSWTLGSVRLKRGTKQAAYVCRVGQYVSKNDRTAWFRIGTDDFSAATDQAFRGGAASQVKIGTTQQQHVKPALPRVPTPAEINQRITDLRASQPPPR